MTPLLRIGWLVVVLLLVCLACQSSWSPRLIQVDESRWLERDRRLLLSRSPWVQQAQVELSGLRGEDRASLHVAASWLSPHFQTARAIMLPRLENRLPLLLAFDPDSDRVTARYRGPVRVPGYPPAGLDRRTLVIAPWLDGGIAFWPTGIPQSAEAHRALGIQPPMDAQIARELDDLTPLSELLAIDLVLNPLLLKAEAPPELERCLAQVMGQTLLRGASILRADGRRIDVDTLIVLSHDIGEHWNEAAKRLAESRPVIAAPVVARLLVARRDADGTARFDENQPQVRLELVTPEGVGELCAKDPSRGIGVSLSIPFSLDAMRVVGMHGV